MASGFGTVTRSSNFNEIDPNSMAQSQKATAEKSETARGIPYTKPGGLHESPKQSTPVGVSELRGMVTRDVRRSRAPQSRLLQLQRSIGSRAVSRLLRSHDIHAKLEIGAVDDPLEREADYVADRVMRMPDSSVRDAAAGTLQRKCTECKEEEEEEHRLSRKEAGNGASLGGTAAPPIVQQALRTPGQPLDAAARSFMERRFGRRFGNVRVHAEKRAVESARAVGALAYTVGQNIVFGAGQYQPSSASGRRLLAHELAHVVQQEPGQFSVQRQPAPNAGQPGPDEFESVNKWLEQHQFALPEQQPKEGEPHVLVNGEDMPVSQAVKLAAAALHLTPEKVNRIIADKFSFAPKKVFSLSTGPYVGKGNLVPGLPRTISTIEDKVAIWKAGELDKLDKWLNVHNFGPPEIRDPTGTKAILDGNDTTIDQVADQALASLGPYPHLTRDDIVTHLRQKYVAARGGPGHQFVIGYTLVPKLLQAVTPAPDPSNPLRTQHQLAFTITSVRHANDSPGEERSLQGSVTVNDAGEIVNLQAGGQEAVVKPLLRGWIQISGLAQIMASVNWSQSATGTTTAVGVQAAVGGQVLFMPNFRDKWPVKLFEGHVLLQPPQVGVQALATVGLPDVSKPSQVQAGANVGLVVNIPFSLVP
jgi:uncharacterized protein DUF4157